MRVCVNGLLLILCRKYVQNVIYLVIINQLKIYHMKSITFLFVLLSVVGIAQEVKKETISFDQYDLIKKVNQFHPDIAISKTVMNYYSTNSKERKLLKTDLVYVPSDTLLSVVIHPDNKSLDYKYTMKKKGEAYGNITIFNGQVFRTYFNINNKSKVFQLYIDDNRVNDVVIPNK